jgi:Domain of unknown function (DUF1707)
VFDVVIVIVIVLASVLLAGMLERSVTAECDRYHRDVAAWASERGWAYYKGARERTWMASLPRGDRVELHVDGTRSGHECTLLYVTSFRETGCAVIAVEATVVVVRLPSAYPTARIEPRGFRRTAGTGHAGFDKEFQVRTDAPGGPSAVVSTQLAEAHLAGKVPLWTLRGQELMCYEDGKTQVEDLEATVDRAVRVAESLRDASNDRRRDAEPEVLLDGPDPSTDEGADARIRISDAEREQAMSLLGLHMSTGRLELAEYEDRCGQAAAARTRAEVELLFGDLPEPHPDLSSAVKPVARIHKPGLLVHMGADAKPAEELRKTPLSSALDAIAGLTFLFGTPYAILLAVKFGIWWAFLPVVVVVILAGGLAEAFKKPSQ